MNFASMTQFTDPGNMLNWLDKQLLALEEVGGQAIIISHVPNIDECLRTYGRRYHALIDRYQNVIRWQLSGHIHQEQWQVATDVLDNQPIGMSYIIGSMTSYQGKPPSFNRVFLDPDTLLPVHFETWAFDLTHMIQHPDDEPVFNLKIDYEEAYNLTDLSPKSFHAAAHEIYRNEEAAKRYRTNRYIGGPGAPVDASCDWICRALFYCQVTSNDFNEWEKCRELTNPLGFDPVDF